MPDTELNAGYEIMEKTDTISIFISTEIWLETKHPWDLPKGYVKQISLGQWN